MPDRNRRRNFSSSRSDHRTTGRLLGYVRYDTEAAREAINHLYRNELRLFQNLFMPSVKLAKEERAGRFASAAAL